MKKKKSRHATFHESARDPASKSHKTKEKLSQSGSSGLKGFADWKRSVAHLLDKSQLSAVDRFRRKKLAFRTAICVGLILATAAVVAAIFGTVYYVQLHRLPQAKPKVIYFINRIFFQMQNLLLRFMFWHLSMEPYE